MNHPLVSVIITTYRNETYLPRAIESVLHQTYPNIQLIVVDDNPPDSPSRAATEKIMTRYPQAIYLRHSENRNGAAARNTGIAAATGKYIAFLDNDDIYSSDHIDTCVRALNKTPGHGSVVTGVVKICGGLCWERIAPPTEPLAQALLFRETALGTGSNLFLTADLVKSLGGFDTRFTRHQDVEFGLRYFEKDQPLVLPQVQIIKEMDGHSNAPNLARFRETKQLLWDTFRDRIDALPEEQYHRYFAGQYSALLYTACKAGDKEQIDAIRTQLQAHRPLNRKEQIMVKLSQTGLFSTYEALKRQCKRFRSGKLCKQILQSLSPYDKEVFHQALSDGKKG
jgi:glycosyltransferase involved in cell wall biosynthesis